MITWAKLLFALVSLSSKLINYCHDQQMITMGEANVLAQLLEQQANVIKEANKVRETARADASGSHDGLMRDDGFKRQ